MFPIDASIQGQEHIPTQRNPIGKRCTLNDLGKQRV
jgi:hypothetical protein